MSRIAQPSADGSITPYYLGVELSDVRAVTFVPCWSVAQNERATHVAYDIVIAVCAFVATICALVLVLQP